jgi:hypothetical protein
MEKRGRPKKRWIDCVRQDMRKMAVSEMTSDRGEWRKRACCADLKCTGKRQGRRRFIYLSHVIGTKYKHPGQNKE